MTVVAVLMWVAVLVWLVRRPWRGRAPSAPATPAVRRPVDDGGTGLLLGHAIAQHNEHFAHRDPLPDGHLGTAADVAFWDGAGGPD